MKTVKLSLLLIIINVLLLSPLHGQEDSTAINKTGQKKNVIHGTVGFYGLGGTFNGNYERMVGENKEKFFTSYWLGAGFGWAALWEDTYRFLIIDFTALTGNGNNHMEFSISFATFKDMWSYEHREDAASHLSGNYWRTYAPAGSIGYRFQKSEGVFIFRTGIGFPDGLYVSAGFRF